MLWTLGRVTELEYAILRKGEEMFQTTRILTGIVHRITLHSVTGNFQLLDDRANDILFFVGIKEEPRRIVLNNRIDGKWGDEISLPCRQDFDREGISVEFKFNGMHIELWNELAARDFLNFNDVCAKSVGLSRMQKCTNPNKSLPFTVMTPEVMDVEINYQIVRLKLDQLEKRMVNIEEKS